MQYGDSTGSILLIRCVSRAGASSIIPHQHRRLYAACSVVNNPGEIIKSDKTGCQVLNSYTVLVAPLYGLYSLICVVNLVINNRQGKKVISSFVTSRFLVVDFKLSNV